MIGRRGTATTRRLIAGRRGGNSVQGLGFAFTPKKQEVLLEKRVLHKLVLTVFAQDQVHFLEEFLRQGILPAIAQFLYALRQGAFFVRTGRIEKQIVVLVGEDVDSDQAAFFSRKDIRIAQVTFPDFHRGPLADFPV
jgi:hypothetical protein